MFYKIGVVRFYGHVNRKHHPIIRRGSAIWKGSSANEDKDTYI